MKQRQIPLVAPGTVATVSIPGSKSYTNRALLMAALSSEVVKINHPLISDDTEAMMACLSELGVKLKRTQDDLEVMGGITDIKDSEYVLDANLSGTTIRFMLALAAVIPGQQTITRGAGLLLRPIGDLVDALRQLGAEIEYLTKDGFPPLRITSSKLMSGTVNLHGGASSQYLSALLMIAPRVGDLTVEITGELVSKPYVDMTIDAMQEFGVTVSNENYQHFQVSSGQSYDVPEYTVEGDVSSASYFFAIAALTSSTITCTNMNPHSKQADMGFLKILEQMGSKVSYGKDEITVAGHGVVPLTVDMEDCPDQAQTLAVLAAFASGTTTISGVQSLRIKETERIQALEQELKKMGVKTESTHDTLIIHGGNPYPASIATYDDHRMAMSFAVAGTTLPGLKIEEPDVVAKTFPDSWEKLEALGGEQASNEQNIVLIGMRGTGKTTVAQLLADKLQREHLDLDQIIVKKLGIDTPTIVKEHGWDYFRDQESATAKQASRQHGKVISTGGGIVLRPENITALKKHGRLILLNASVETMHDRLGDMSDRPPLTTATDLRSEIKQVGRERQKLYEAAADDIIDTDKLSPEAVVEQIIKLMGDEK